MNTKSKYTDSELLEFKTLLLSKKEKAELQLQEFESQLKEMTSNGKDEHSFENSGFEVQKEYLASYIHRTQKHLVDIKNALLRIQNKNYGVCSVTGKLIDKKRLLAVPTTTKSLEAKS